MPKHLLIKETSLPQSLQSLSSHSERLVYLEIPDSNQGAMINIISNINNDEFILSSSISLEEGNISEIILLPKSAGKK